MIRRKKLFAAINQLILNLMFISNSLLMAFEEDVDVLFWCYRNIFKLDAPSNGTFKLNLYVITMTEKDISMNNKYTKLNMHGHFIVQQRNECYDVSQVYKRSTNLINDKYNLSHGEVKGWIRGKLSSALVRSCITCSCKVLDHDDIHQLMTLQWLYSITVRCWYTWWKCLSVYFQE